MEVKQISPASLVINLFGGVRPLARAIKLDPAAVSRWQKKGTIPAYIQRQVLEKAWDMGIEISPDEIIFGRLDEEALEQSDEN